MVPLALGIVITDANVVTLSREQPSAHHVAIVDGRFAYVGDDLSAARRAAGPDARQLDAFGATIVPGFNDAHVHFGLSLTIGAPEAIVLRNGTDNRALFERTIEDAAAKPIPAGGHDWIFVTTPSLPEAVRTSADLPKINRPLFIVTEHGGLMNALAMKRAGFTGDETPSGSVRGRLLPAALDRVVKSLPAKLLLARAQRFLGELASVGITTVQLMDELPEIFETLRVEGKLTARVRMMVFGYRFDTAIYRPTWKPIDPSFVQLDAVKYFHDDWARLPRHELEQVYDDTLASGRSVVIHVLSRAALRSLLDQLEHLEHARPGGAKHFRLDHVDEVTPELVGKLHKLGVTVCPNPAMLPEWRSDTAFPLHTLQAGGVATCIGSDWVGRHTPARPISPLFGLQEAVTHGGYGMKERVSADDALRAYTLGSAHAEGREDKGAIRVGALGDLVGLAGDPTAVAPEAIADLEVRFTVVGGRVVFERRPPVIARTPQSTIGPPKPSTGVRPPPSTIGPVPAPPKSVTKK